MTRINASIAPAELCDQMLLGEIRELPRIVKLCWNRANRHGDSLGNLPSKPTLGKGHVTYFAKYGKYLCNRHQNLVEEATRRGFKIQRPPITPKCFPLVSLVEDIPFDHLVAVRPLLEERIRERISQMKRKPAWTARSKPEWL